MARAPEAARARKSPPSWVLEWWAEPVNDGEADADAAAEESTSPAALTELEADPEEATEPG